jgi:F0F1-type ATP synthase assembly protein I
MEPKKQPKDFKDAYLLARAWGIGSGIIFLCVVGYFLDQHFHTDNVYILIGFGMGIVYTAYEIYKTVKAEK